MNSVHLISLSLGIIGGLVVVVSAVVTAARVWRKWRAARSESIVEPLRAALIRLASGDDEVGSTVDYFVGLPAREWCAIRPHVIDLCRKLDRDSAVTLRSVLIERGVLSQAIRDTQRRSPVRRARAAMVLELFPTMESRRALIGLLSDRDADVRRMAVRSVGTVGDADSVPHVIATLQGHHRVTPTSVGRSLILLGSIAVDDLVATVQSHSDERVLECCVEVLGHVGDPRAVPCLIAALATSEPELGGVRVVAARALGRLGSPRAISALLEGLKVAEAELAVACIDALVEIGGLGIEALRSNDVAGDLTVIDALGRPSVQERHESRNRIRVDA